MKKTTKPAAVRVAKEISDIALVRLFKKGSTDAFEELVSRYETKAYNLAMRLTRNQEDAEEVMQDVFTTVYLKVKSFEGKSAFSSWLYRIIVNSAFMSLRKRKQQQTIGIDDLSPTMRQHYVEHDAGLRSRSDVASLNKELRIVLQRSIDRLPEQYRAVFILRDVDGLSNQETGEILDLSIPAVKSRLHRSRIMLRRRLQNYWTDYQGRKDDVIAFNFSEAV